MMDGLYDEIAVGHIGDWSSDEPYPPRKYGCRCCGKSNLCYSGSTLVDDDGNRHICNPQDMIEHAKSHVNPFDDKAWDVHCDTGQHERFPELSSEQLEMEGDRW